MIRHLAAGLVTVGVALAAAPTAHATEIGFLRDLTDYGFVITDAVLILDLGYTICGALEVMNGTEVAATLYRADQGEVYDSFDDAGFVVLAAVNNLCPEMAGTPQAGRKTA